MPILDPNELDNTLFQPVLSHQFIMYIDGIPSYMIKKVDGIGFDDGEVIVDHINTYFKTRAKRRYNDVSVSLYNPVAPSGAQAMTEWARLGYEVVTGRAGYADFYWKDLTMCILDPVGSIVGEWIIKRAFIKSLTYGSYDWSDDNFTTFEMTVACSGVIINY